LRVATFTSHKPEEMEALLAVVTVTAAAAAAAAAAVCASFAFCLGAIARACVGACIYVRV